jgi:hypothetical protein
VKSGGSQESKGVKSAGSQAKSGSRKEKSARRKVLCTPLKNPRQDYPRTTVSARGRSSPTKCP